MRLEPTTYYEIKKLAGVEDYNAGLTIFNKGGVGAINDLGHNLSYIDVCDGGDVFTVTVREFPDGHEPTVECDCRRKNCRHMAAILVSMSSEDIGGDDDPEVIAQLEKDIDRLYEDVVSDNDYDEEANYYEDWEIDKYGLENNNDQVEYDYAHDLCRRILDDVSNPVAAPRLFGRLHKAFKEFEYDNGGFDDAISDVDAELKALFTYADPETIAQIITSGSWGEGYLKYAPKEAVAASRNLIGKQPTLNRTGLQMVLEDRDYDTYIEKSPGKTEAYITVIREMRKTNDPRITQYAKALSGRIGSDNHSDVKIADEIRDLGFREEAALVYSKSFLSDLSSQTFGKFKEVSDKKAQEALLDEAVGKYLSGKAVSISTATRLAECGRCKEVESFIRKVGYSFENRYCMDRYEGAEKLCRVLADNGYIETSARIAHDTIEYRMNPRDAKHYNEGVSMLKFLDSDERFETIEPKHSEYLANLRAERKTMRKFWGMYDGTWVGKDRRDEWW